MFLTVVPHYRNNDDMKSKFYALKRNMFVSVMFLSGVDCMKSVFTALQFDGEKNKISKISDFSFKVHVFADR